MPAENMKENQRLLLILFSLCSRGTFFLTIFFLKHLKERKIIEIIIYFLKFISFSDHPKDILLWNKADLYKKYNYLFFFFVIKCKKNWNKKQTK